jgi:hypothetical protein
MAHSADKTATFLPLAGVAIALSLLLTFGSASALDLDGKVGGIGVGASLGGGPGGLSVGVEAGLGGLGGAKVGASVDTSKGSAGSNVGANANVNGVAAAKAAASAATGNGSVGATVGASANIDKVGRAEVGASVAAGKSAIGANVGVAASVDGVGKTSAGVSVGAPTGPVGVSAGVTQDSAQTRGNAAVDAEVGGTAPSRATSAISGNAAAPSAGPRQTEGRGMGAATSTPTSKSGLTPGVASRTEVTTAIRRTVSFKPNIVLPRALAPSRKGGASKLRAPLGAVPGIPAKLVGACRKAIASAAAPFGAVRVRAASAGQLRRSQRGLLVAPINVRIDYAAGRSIEVRQARVRCRIDAAGRVTNVT